MNKSYLFLAVFSVVAAQSESRPLYLAQSVKYSTKKIKKNKSTEASPQQTTSSAPKDITTNAEKSSQTLTVKTALKQYTLKYDKNKISIKGYRLDLSLKRKQCNAHIIDRFNNEIRKFIKEQMETGAFQKTVGKTSIETIEIQIGQKNYFISTQSKAGATFLSLPNEIIRMKWEEKIGCTQKRV